MQRTNLLRVNNIKPIFIEGTGKGYQLAYKNILGFTETLGKFKQNGS